MPLPLFPRLIAWYLERETRQTSVAAAASGSLLSQLLSASHAWRSYLLSWSGASATLARASGKNWDVVLLGGAMGSLFSFCQCIISPWLGGRRCNPLVVSLSTEADKEERADHQYLTHTAGSRCFLSQCSATLYLPRYGYAVPPL